MSFTYTREVFKAKLPGMEKLILWVLAERANDEGRCFPGQSRIAKDAGVSYKTIQRYLDKLIAKGVIRIVGQKQYKNTLALGTCEYELDLGAIRNLGSESTQGVGSEATGVGTERPQGVAGEYPGGGGEYPGVGSERPVNQSEENQSGNQSQETVKEEAEEEAFAAPAASADLPLEESGETPETPGNDNSKFEAEYLNHQLNDYLIPVAKTYGLNGNRREEAAKLIPLLKLHNFSEVNLAACLRYFQLCPDTFMGDRCSTWSGLLKMAESGAMFQQFRKAMRKAQAKGLKTDEIWGTQKLGEAVANTLWPPDKKKKARA